MDDPLRTPPDTAWQRFLDQKTAPQRFLIAVAAAVGAVVTIGAGIVAVSGLLDRGATTGDPSHESLARVRQGGPSADAFVRLLLRNGGGRVALDSIVASPAGTQPFEHGDVPLRYNCRGRPVGDDNCNRVRLQLSDDDARPPDVVDRSAVHYRGTYSVRIGRGTVYGTDLDIVLDNVIL